MGGHAIVATLSINGGSRKKGTLEFGLPRVFLDQIKFLDAGRDDTHAKADEVQ